MEMGKYVLLGNWTDQGIRDVKNTVKRSRAAREAFAAMTKATLALAVQGNLRTTTMRGFGEKEMESLLSSLT
jgi:uncharacterized protein with GYD domain